MQATAQAQPNIALVKYWGKRDQASNVPAVDSLSITLDSLWTRTSVRFDPTLTTDRIVIDGAEASASGGARVSACIDLLRAKADTRCRAEVHSRNNFPAGAGLASSASAFAALVTASAGALGLQLSDADRSRMARRASGSAARSIFGGFVQMPATWDADTVAEPLLEADAWPLSVVVAITSSDPKPIGSTEGMVHTARTSTYYPAWADGSGDDFRAARAAVLARDIEALAIVAERSCLRMHGLMLAADPGLIYWNGGTVDCLHRVRALRRGGTPVFFTVDAGPQVKAVCPPGYAASIRAALAEIPGVQQVLQSGLGAGARLVEAAP